MLSPGIIDGNISHIFFVTCLSWLFFLMKWLGLLKGLQQIFSTEMENEPWLSIMVANKKSLVIDSLDTFGLVISIKLIATVKLRR